MNRISIGLLIFAVVTSGSAQGAFVGAPSSSAGVVEREIYEEFVESAEVSPNKPAPLLDVDLPEDQLDLGSDEKILVSSIHITGNTSLSTQALQGCLKSYVGRELSIVEIYDACYAIRQVYACAGYFLARAYPPEQKIENGVLTLEVIEGRLGDIFVEGNCYYNSSFVCSYFSRFQNCAVNYDAFIRSLLLINDHMDISVGAIFKKGSRYGTADVVLKVADHRPVHLYLNSNNYGSKSTSNQRTGGRIDYGNLFLNGDKFTIAQVVGSPLKGLLFTDVSYTIPLTHRGMFLRGSYLHNDFDVGVLTELDLHGRSDVASGQWKQAWRRTRSLSTDVYLGFDYKEIKNKSKNSTQSFDKLRNFNGGFLFDWVDSWKGRNIGDVKGVAGVPDFWGGSSAVDKKSSRSGAGAKFWITSFDYTRVQNFFWDINLIFRLTAQYSPFKLPYAEAIYIGGAEATRGYQVATAIGDNGYRFTFELRAPPPFIKCCKAPFSHRQWKDVLQFVAFYDRGQVWLNGGDITAQKGNIPLNGVGFGVRLYGPWKFEWSYDVGFGLTGEKKPSKSVHYLKVTWKVF